MIIKLAADGDVLRTTSIIPILKKKYPNCTITWITEPSASPLLENNPLIDRTIHDSSYYIPMLSLEKFDWVINPDADRKSWQLATLAFANKKSWFILDDMGHVKCLSGEAEKWFSMGIWDDLKKENNKSYQSILYSMVDIDNSVIPPTLFLNLDEIAWAKQHLQSLGGEKQINELWE